MSNNTDIQIARATAAQYVRETAKAQIAYDKMLAAADSFSDDADEIRDHIENGREAKRLAFCKAKAEEWANEADRLEAQRHAEVVADMEDDL